jgi:hypothetical protein
MRRNPFRSLIVVFMLCLSLAFATPSAARQYDNVRFAFSVEIGDPDWQMLPPSANGDGMAFQSRSVPDASIVFYGRNQIEESEEEDSIEREAASALPSDAQNVSRVVNRGSFYIEYDHEDLHTQVLTFLVDGVFYTGLACAPRKALDRFKPEFQKILKTWKIRGWPTGY